ncbi:hypothetical protein KC19_4G102200 [Ceratodon purpureus]|uniref:Legume lectin domain-containing protein n=1 Tax=Ceratodon purpureus TaxID=3225 RepID=A0A8T0IAG0_CERPU|nr:hypothetical protein KC19_4G102200 [Ceratodon purpureus]KAG0579484.1 hypothetical protein KC19_4G102200 [Ceratodon purpureus]KAG0579485.1 hypothetical protein KC19_4G102200 [Ceratodon purpureus]
MANHHVALLLFVALLASFEMPSLAETAPKSVTVSFPPSSKFLCTIDPSPNEPGVKASDVCRPSVEKPTHLILSNINDVISARYQWNTPVQLWKKNSKYVASFNAYFVVNFDRDAEFTQRPLFSGGGVAFAFTPALSGLKGTGPETFGLFPIDEATGASLRGAKTKTVAVELDLSRTSNTGFDPLAPHTGLDINSMKSVKTKYLGDPDTIIDVKIGVWVEYDALKTTLKVFLHKVKANLTPNRKNANIAISYTGLDLAKEVNEFSYVGFGSRVPEQPNGMYRIYDFKFTTKWVLGSKVNK